MSNREFYLDVSSGDKMSNREFYLDVSSGRKFFCGDGMS